MKPGACPHGADAGSTSSGARGRDWKQASIKEYREGGATAHRELGDGSLRRPHMYRDSMEAREPPDRGLGRNAQGGTVTHCAQHWI